MPQEGREKIEHGGKGKKYILQTNTLNFLTFKQIIMLGAIILIIDLRKTTTNKKTNNTFLVAFKRVQAFISGLLK